MAFAMGLTSPYLSVRKSDAVYFYYFYYYMACKLSQF